MMQASELTIMPPFTTASSSATRDAAHQEHG